MTKKLSRLARLGQNLHRSWKFIRLLAHAQQIGIKASKNKDPARWQLAGYIEHQAQAISSGHRYIAQQQMGKKPARTLKSLIRAVGYSRIEPTLSEDKRKRICDQTIIINDQHSLRFFDRILHVRFQIFWCQIKAIKVTLSNENQ